MQLEVPHHSAPIGPLDWHKILPFAPVVSSNRLGWVGLGAAHCRSEPAFERLSPAIPHHRLVLNARPPEQLDLRFEGVKRHLPHPAGSITLVPAGTEALVRSSGHKDELHVFLNEGLVTRVAEEEFGLDSARLTVPPIDGLDLPQFRAILGAVEIELTTGCAGGPLMAESLANLLAVQLIRHIQSPRQPVRGSDGKLPRTRLRAVVDYIEEHLEAGMTLEQMAEVARVSPFHFARQFKAATGLPPYQYVISRRVDRAKQLMNEGIDLSLAEVAAHVGFSDQSQFSHHLKRVLGVTPGQFRLSARVG
jgi:AraC family transcriptional regulator